LTASAAAAPAAVRFRNPRRLTDVVFDFAIRNSLRLASLSRGPDALIIRKVGVSSKP